MPESANVTSENQPDIDETITVSKVWLDSVLNGLQTRIGNYEVNNTSLQVNLEIEKARNEKLKGQIDELAQRLSAHDNTTVNTSSDSRSD